MGRATTKQAVSAGATVIAADIDEVGLATLADELGHHCVPLQFDLRSEAEIKNILACIDGLGGKLDVLVNNAGAAKLESVVDLTAEAIDNQYKVLLRGPMQLTSALIPYLTKNGVGSIVNISSIGAVVNVPVHAAYASFKAALEKFSRITLRECPGVRVNVVQPGFIDTPLLNHYGSEEQKQALLHEVAERVAVGRVGTPDDVANTVLFLASPFAAYINGAEILVDGGYCAAPFDFSL